MWILFRSRSGPELLQCGIAERRFNAAPHRGFIVSQHESATPVQIRVSPKNKIPVAPGDVFGRLTVIREVEHAVNWPRRLECRCECGNTAVALLANMTRGRTVSCGC